MTNFEELEIWKVAIDLGIRVFKLADKMPFSLRSSLGDQLRRAYLSISSNIAEGCGSESIKDELNFISIARKSCFECVSQLHFYQELSKSTETETLIEETKVLAKRIHAYKKKRGEYRISNT